MGDTAATAESVFDEVGWDVCVVRSHADVTEASGESWSAREAHAMMLALRDSSDLDTEWRYHCLAVRRFDLGASATGWMYDDSGAVMREGLMVASHWVVPDEQMWGRAQGRRFGTVAPACFRTALHELGHAMGLVHEATNSIMMPTAEVAQLSEHTPGDAVPRQHRHVLRRRRPAPAAPLAGPRRAAGDVGQEGPGAPLA